MGEVYYGEWGLSVEDGMNMKDGTKEQMIYYILYWIIEYHQGRNIPCINITNIKLVKSYALVEQLIR